MKLMTAEQRRKLLANGAKSADDPAFSAVPVIKLFNPMGVGTWLISELDPTNPDYAYGLADLGQGCPELGTISISELESVKLPWGMKIERDRSWSGSKTIGEYAKAARDEGRIVA